MLRVISDLHLGHKNICKFENSKRNTTPEEHDEWIVNQWNSVVKPNETVIVLGDVAFNKKSLDYLARMNGTKKLVMGNHDHEKTSDYLKYFKEVYGVYEHKEFIMTHIPIKEDSLRGKYNVHGHTHSNVIKSGDYFCVCVEALDGKPIHIDELRGVIDES